MKTEFHQVNVREFQHHLASYLDLAQTMPLTVTKRGKKVVVLINPYEYKIIYKKESSSRQNRPKRDLLKSRFIGMHKDKKSWQGQTNLQIADRLRADAWYGK